MTYPGYHGRLQASDGIHSLAAWKFADSTARTNFTPTTGDPLTLGELTSDDLGRVGWQTNDNSLWMLTSTTPTWVQLTQGGDSSIISITAKKATAGTINAGQPVRITGWDGVDDIPLVELGFAGAFSIGLANEGITDTVAGAVVISGQVSSITTTGLVEGSPFYVSATPGQLQATIPDYPSLVQAMGITIYENATEGVLGVSAQAPLIFTSSLPSPLGTAATGSNQRPARADHTHEHGNLLGGALHEVATTSSAGFMSTDNVVSLTRLAVGWESAGEPSGFPNRTGSNISWNDGTRTFTIAPAATEYDFFVKGKQYIKSSSLNIVWPDTEGLHFFYFNAFGTLETSTDENKIPELLLGSGSFISAHYWDASNNISFLRAEERHGFMPGDTHLYFHNAFGAQWVSGGELGNFSVDQDGSQSTHAQFDVDTVTLYDEDIRLTHTDGNPQDMTPILVAPIYYILGATPVWRRKTAGNFPLIYSDGLTFTGANDRIPYNQNNGGTWQLTEVNEGYFINMFYFASNDVVSPVFGIQGRAQYSTKQLAEARYATELKTILNDIINEFPLAKEVIPLGCVIFQTNSTYLNTPKARIVSVATGINYNDLRGLTFKRLEVAAHATTHILSGTDPIEGDKLSITYAPTAYTPTSASTGGDPSHLAAHLKGLDNKVAEITGSVSDSADKFASYIVLAITSSLPNERTLTEGDGINIADNGAGSTVVIKNTRPGDLGASYVVIGTTGSLPNERVLSNGTGINVNDGGAGNSVTVGINNSVVATVSGTNFTGPVSASNGFSWKTAPVSTWPRVNTGGSTVLNFLEGQKRTCILTASTTFTSINYPGPGTYQVWLKQDATGSRTITWPAALRFAGGTDFVASTGSNDLDVVSISYDGTDQVAQGIADFV